MQIKKIIAGHLNGLVKKEFPEEIVFQSFKAFYDDFTDNISVDFISSKKSLSEELVCASSAEFSAPQSLSVTKSSSGPILKRSRKRQENEKKEIECISKQLKNLIEKENYLDVFKNLSKLISKYSTKYPEIVERLKEYQRTYQTDWINLEFKGITYLRPDMLIPVTDRLTKLDKQAKKLKIVSEKIESIMIPDQIEMQKKIRELAEEIGKFYGTLKSREMPSYYVMYIEKIYNIIKLLHENSPQNHNLLSNRIQLLNKIRNSTRINFSKEQLGYIANEVESRRILISPIAFMMRIEGYRTIPKIMMEIITLIRNAGDEICKKWVNTYEKPKLKYELVTPEKKTDLNQFFGVFRSGSTPYEAFKELDPQIVLDKLAVNELPTILMGIYREWPSETDHSKLSETFLSFQDIKKLTENNNLENAFYTAEQLVEINAYDNYKVSLEKQMFVFLMITIRDYLYHLNYILAAYPEKELEHGRTSVTLSQGITSTFGKRMNEWGGTDEASKLRRQVIRDGIAIFVDAYLVKQMEVSKKEFVKPALMRSVSLRYLIWMIKNKKESKPHLKELNRRVSVKILDEKELDQIVMEFPKNNIYKKSLDYYKLHQRYGSLIDSTSGIRSKVLQLAQKLKLGPDELEIKINEAKENTSKGDQKQIDKKEEDELIANECLKLLEEFDNAVEIIGAVQKVNSNVGA